MAKKTARKAARPKAVKIVPAATGKSAKSRTPEPKKGNTRAAAAPAETAPVAVVGKPEVKKIQGLLKSKTTEGVTLALSLLDSLDATRADYEAVFTETVMKCVLSGWAAESWAAVARALLPLRKASSLFLTLAEQKYLKRPRLHGDFDGLILMERERRAAEWRARAPAAKAAFLARRGRAARPQKPFIDLVEIPVGSFLMGSPRDEDERGDDEDQVEVQVTKSFSMGRTVVTQQQWREVMGTEPWRYEGLRKNQCGDKFPAVYVSWDEAVHFCQTLTELERETGRLKPMQSYRLPTEAEWEYACRAGTTTAYSFGDSSKQLAEHGWYDSNSGGRIHKVAGKKPNPWGLLDMHGNVWEWCSDWYHANLVGGIDPSGPTGETDGVVCRGGDYCREASFCRSAYRSLLCIARWRRSLIHGFRVVCER